MESDQREAKMKYVKTLGVFPAIVVTLMALATISSATTLTSPTGTPYTGEIHTTSEGTLLMRNPIANSECHSTIRATSLTHGVGQTAQLLIEDLLWGKSGNLNGICHGNWHVTTITPGILQIHWKSVGEGTVTWSGAKIRTTLFGINCIYTTNNTDLGSITDSHKMGSTATLHVSASIPIDEESSPFCGSGNVKWEGSYQFEAPDAIYIDQN